MNYIFWDIDKISMLTDTMNASSHSHGMLQFFVSTEGPLDLKAGGEKVVSSCALVNKNVRHSFKTSGRICFTCLIEPASIMGMKLSSLLSDRPYFIPDEDVSLAIREKVSVLAADPERKAYKDLIEKIGAGLDIGNTETQLDDRIRSFLDMLKDCSCDDHSIEEYAGRLCLSQSRLSHLFSEQVGIPLKKYLILHQLEKAFEWILEGRSITEAAMKAGFDSPSHFASAVKKQMGLPARSTVKDSVFLKVY